MIDLMVDFSKHRAQLFAKYKMRSPEMYIRADQLVDWLLEFEEILNTGERRAIDLLKEHMNSGNHPFVMKIGEKI